MAYAEIREVMEGVSGCTYTLPSSRTTCGSNKIVSEEIFMF